MASQKPAARADQSQTPAAAQANRSANASGSRRAPKVSGNSQIFLQEEETK